MARGFINVSNGGGSSSIRYILRNGECVLWESNISNDKSEVISKVRKMENIEKIGNSELNIRGRHDARAMKKLIISLPNNLSNEDNKKYLDNVINKVGISEYPYVIAIHNGLKDGIENRHAHINFFERKFEKGNSNKNRYFNQKKFVSDIKEAYKSQFNFEFNNSNSRTRIPRQEYQNIKEININKEIIKSQLNNLKMDEFKIQFNAFVTDIKSEIEKQGQSVINGNASKEINIDDIAKRHNIKVERGTNGDVKFYSKSNISWDNSNKIDQLVIKANNFNNAWSNSRTNNFENNLYKGLNKLEQANSSTKKVNPKQEYISAFQKTNISNDLAKVHLSILENRNLDVSNNNNTKTVAIEKLQRIEEKKTRNSGLSNNKQNDISR